MLIAQRSSEVTRGEKHSSALNATQSSGKIPSRVSATRSAQGNSPAFFAPHHRNSSSESRRRFRDDPALVVRPSLQQPQRKDVRRSFFVFVEPLASYPRGHAKGLRSL